MLGNTGSLTKTGYTFNNWNTAADGSDTSYAPADTFSISANTTLYAQWAANTYQVAFDANGATGGLMSNQNFTYDVVQNLTTNEYTKTGAVFNGWNTASDGTGNSYTNEQNVSNLTATNGATVTLYAQWTTNPSPTPSPTASPVPTNSPTPSPTPSPTASPVPSSSSTSSLGCNDQSPGAKAPWLYGAIAQDSSSVLLYFTEADNPVDKYVLEYGTKSGDYLYGAQDMGVNSRGPMTFLVQALQPNTTYYFRVRGGNGCATGPWSNEIYAKTKGLVTTNNLDFVSSELTPIEEASQSIETNSNCQTYVVKPGDTLWSIAKNILGNGNKYKEIISQNKDKYSTLETSNNLETGWELKVSCNQQTTEQEQKTIDSKTQASYKVKVKVVDTQNKPVIGAKVTLHSTPREATTDKNGIVNFENVEAGEHQVLIAYNGYKGEQTINLTGNVKEFDLEIKIQKDNLSISPLLYGIIGITGLVITVLVILLVKKKRKV